MANVKVDIDQTALVWAKQMYDMICKVSEKIDEMGVSQNMLEEKANKAQRLQKMHKGRLLS